jgi:hypothetical protein
MVTTRALAGLLTLTLGGVALAQYQTPPPSPPAQGTDPSAASSPHQRDVTSQPGPEAQSSPSDNPTAASTKHQHEVTDKVAKGTAVEDQSGQSLGSVTDVVKGTGSAHSYVVISSPDGKSTAVPSHVAHSMTKEGRIVIDRTALDGAPKVRLSELSAHDTHWQKKSDQYWAQHAG